MYYVFSIDSISSLIAFLGCPSAPQNIHATDVWRDHIAISWDSPETDGGSPLTGYVVQCRDSFESTYRLLATVKPDMTSYTATGLQEGRDYYLRVFSQNAAGLSEHPVELLPAVKARLPFGTQLFLAFLPTNFCHVTATSGDPPDHLSPLRPNKPDIYTGRIFSSCLLLCFIYCYLVLV